MDNETILCACGCGETLLRYDRRGRERKFLPSHYSKLQPNTLKDVTCAYCGKTLKRPRWHRKMSPQHFCNPACFGAYASESGLRAGENNGHYNTISTPCAGGCGKTVQKARSLIERRSGNVYCEDCVSLVRKGRRGFYVGYPCEFNSTLRKAIRQRDNYTCQICGKEQKRVGYTLHVHHIDYDKHNNSQDNLISLCRKCHGQTNFGTDGWRQKLSVIMRSRSR